MLPTVSHQGCPGPVACDQARQAFALSECELRDRVASLEADAAAYRLVAHTAVEQLAHVTTQLENARRESSYLREQLRALVHADRETAAARQRRSAA